MKTSKEDFVKCWQRSSTVLEVATKTGLSLATCKRYAWKFRKNEVPLKQLEDEGKKKTDWDSLKLLATELGE